MKNSSYHTSDVKNICEKKLHIQFRAKRADHYNGWFCLGEKKAKRITVAKGRKPIPQKTYGAMAKQLGLDVEQFDDLLDCPLSLEKYIEIITPKKQ